MPNFHTHSATVSIAQFLQYNMYFVTEQTDIEIGVGLIRLTLACRNMDKRIAARVRLTVDEIHCLCELHLTQPSCVRELSDVLQTSPPRTSKILHSLEQQGYVTRSLQPSDRRMEKVTLTDVGRIMGEKIVSYYCDEGKSSLLSGAETLEKKGLRIPAAIL